MEMATVAKSTLPDAIAVIIAMPSTVADTNQIKTMFKLMTITIHKMMAMRKKGGDATSHADGDDGDNNSHEGDGNDIGDGCKKYIENDAQGDTNNYNLIDTCDDNRTRNYVE